MKNLYWKNPAFKDTTDFSHIKNGYYAGISQVQYLYLTCEMKMSVLTFSRYRSILLALCQSVLSRTLSRCNNAGYPHRSP